MTARTRHIAAFLDELSQPGPEAQRFASMVENNREWFAQLRADREAEYKPQNRCCVTSWPAGHPFACNDCDPCLFGSHPSEWCTTCGGDQWINDRPCYNCDGSGFRQRLNDACQVRETDNA